MSKRLGYVCELVHPPWRPDNGEHQFSRNHPHGGEPRRLHRSKGWKCGLARDLRQIRQRGHHGPGVRGRVPQDVDCYVMGSRTYETALEFEARGFGWSYGDKPTFILTSRELPRTRDTVEFYSGDLARLVNERLKPAFPSIWFVGGGAVSGECLRLGLADEVRYSIMPILIGDGISFFEGLDKDVALHLVEVKAYESGMVALRHEVRK